MKSKYLLLSCLSAMLLTLPAFAQLSAPNLPELSVLTFGWASMSGIDPTLDMFTAFAPTMIGLQDAGYRSGAEAVAGQFAFSGFHVDSNFESAIATAGPGLLRVAHYGYKSNQAALAGEASLGLPPDTLARTNGDAIELSYAQRCKDVVLGASLVPQDNAGVSLSGPSLAQGGIASITGNANEAFGWRVGGTGQLPKNIRIGADYSYQRSTSTALINMVDPEIPPIAQSADFINRVSTVGASWRACPNTLLYAAYQDILSTGSNQSRRHATNTWFGVQQNVSPKLVVRANYLSGGQNFSFTWQSPVGLITAAYTHKALTNAQDVLGSGDAFFGGVAFALK